MMERGNHYKNNNPMNQLDYSLLQLNIKNLNFYNTQIQPNKYISSDEKNDIKNTRRIP